MVEESKVIYQFLSVNCQSQRVSLQCQHLQVFNRTLPALPYCIKYKGTTKISFKWHLVILFKVKAISNLWYICIFFNNQRLLELDQNTSVSSCLTPRFHNVNRLSRCKSTKSIPIYEKVPVPIPSTLYWSILHQMVVPKNQRKIKVLMKVKVKMIFFNNFINYYL